MQDYLIKFSLSLAVFFTFYYLCLRPLTFYQWNRACLLVYSFLCFLIPLINITPWIQKQGMDDITVFNSFPIISISNMQIEDESFFEMLTITNVLLILFLTGVAVMMLRFILRCLSLGNVRKKAALLSTYKNVHLYNVSENISPFSFGQSIFVNKDMHDDEELQRIIQHEFVHVKQKHTIDLILAELICIINWFNPFAWLIRSAIRQNLEFIADEKVIANGIDKKEYQYLLLKVIGAPAYGLANHLKFSDLKKRIAMMNKMKSTKLHLTKFMFALPLLAVILLAFREGNQKTTEAGDTKFTSGPIGYNEPTIQQSSKISKPLITDTVPKKKTAQKETKEKVELKVVTASEIDTLPRMPKDHLSNNEVNEKGYIISSVIGLGDKIIIVKDKNKKIIESVYLEDWNKDKEYEKKYGHQNMDVAIALGIAPGNNLREPLYIVDGVIQEGTPMKNIPKEDIESIQILRNEAAKKIYGEKGANGVIVIELKAK